MKIPKKLKIGGHVITIECDKELEGKDGVFSTKENKIKICSTLPDSQKAVTLIHEIFHALNSTMDESQISHIFVESLAQQFYQVLSDNNMLR